MFIVFSDQLAIEEGAEASGSTSSVVDLSEAYHQSDERRAKLMQCNEIRNNSQSAGRVGFNMFSSTMYNTIALWQVCKDYNYLC